MLGSLPEEQRAVAELALQGMAAVRQRLREDNARSKAAGKPEMPEATVLKMAEDLLPQLRVADWLDRAEAAQRQLAHLDLRDLRSVVAASEDPLVVRDESTRALAAELKTALAVKQDEELNLWLADVEAAVDVGRVVRALRLSAMPPKAGVPFPAALGGKLGTATIAALTADDPPDRWIAVLEAAAFSPDSHAGDADRRAGAAESGAGRHGDPARSTASAGRRPVRHRGAGQGADAEAVAPAATQEGAGPQTGAAAAKPPSAAGRPRRRPAPQPAAEPPAEPSRWSRPPSAEPPSSRARDERRAATASRRDADPPTAAEPPAEASRAAADAELADTGRRQRGDNRVTARCAGHRDVRGRRPRRRDHAQPSRGAQRRQR